MSISLNKNIGAYLKSAYAAASTSVTAAGSGDNTAVTGVAVDRAAIGLPLSAVVVYAIAATMANTKTLSMAYKVQHAIDAAFTVVTDLPGAIVANAVVLTAKADGSAQTFAFQHSVNLNGAMQFVRIVYTPDLSNTATDTAVIQTAWVFAGMNELPQA